MFYQPWCRDARARDCVEEVSFFTSCDVVSLKSELPVADQAVGQRSLAEEYDGVLDALTDLDDDVEEEGALNASKMMDVNLLILS